MRFTNVDFLESNRKGRLKLSPILTEKGVVI